MKGRDMKNHAEWEKTNIRQITLKLHKVNDKEIIDFLETKPNKRAYLVELIKRDMNNEI